MIDCRALTEMMEGEEEGKKVSVTTEKIIKLSGVNYQSNGIFGPGGHSVAKESLIGMLKPGTHILEYYENSLFATIEGTSIALRVSSDARFESFTLLTAANQKVE